MKWKINVQLKKQINKSKGLFSEKANRDKSLARQIREM